MSSTTEPTVFDEPRTATPHHRQLGLPTWWPWAVGVLVGLVVLGPGLGGGSLLSLDLLVTPHIPVPNGIYGLGPALSQRVPLFAIVGLGSALVGGPVITKLLIVGFLATGFAGAARLVRVLAPAGMEIGAVGQAAAGLLWAAGPYALTRVAVGHINLLWVIAILPWVLPRLCRPAEHVPSTFLASLAMAIGGPGGGTLGVTIALVVLVVQPKPRRFVRPLAAIAVPQLIWVLPTAVLLWSGAGVAGATRFATQAHGVAGWPALAVGNGFWRADYQVGSMGIVGGLAGVAVSALAIIGGVRIVRRCGMSSWQGAATLTGALGLALAVASAVPVVRSGYGWLSDLSVGAPLRESHRFLAIWLVWAAPAIVIGAAVVAESLTARGTAGWRWIAAGVRWAPLVVAVAVSLPGWWGIDGRLKPVDYPAGWAVARHEIAQHPGPVVALPWSEYPSLSFADDRQVFNPVPDFLGGDVISSYDPLFDREVVDQEQVDRRADVVDELAHAARSDQPIAGPLADLGVRWVFLAHEGSWEQYSSLYGDPGLRRVLALDDADLYEVTGWAGGAVAPDGTGHDLRRPVPPVIRTDAPKGSILNVSGAPGWVQGWSSPARVTDDGRLQLTGSAGLVWFWPAVVLLAVDVMVAGLAIWAASSRRKRFGRILAPRATRG